jgi:hypothetical protein
MIKSAQDIRSKMQETEEYRLIVDKEVSSVMRAIEIATDRGLTSTCFSVSYHYRDEIKKMFLAKGYSFRPTGYIGGVWQQTEHICW